MDEFERKKKELEQLQGDEMRTQMLQLEELQLKYDLIKKKQVKDRQNLLKQQKEKILKMRLQEEKVDSPEVMTSSPHDKTLPAFSWGNSLVSLRISMFRETVRILGKIFPCIKYIFCIAFNSVDFHILGKFE